MKDPKMKQRFYDGDYEHNRRYFPAKGILAFKKSEK